MIDLAGRDVDVLARLRAAQDAVARSLPLSSTGSLACAIRRSCSSVASRWTISSVSVPSLTTRYGVVTKPYSEISA